MASIIIGAPSYDLFTQAGINANANTVGDEYEMGGYTIVAFEVLANTGTHGTHIVTMQCSLDGTTWMDTAETVTGLGMKEIAFTGAYKIRFKVTTVEGAASAIDISGILK